MEIKSNVDNSKELLYQKISNSWNVIINYLDINTIFQIELVSKYFRKRILSFYESKENLLKNNPLEKEKPLNEQNEKEVTEHIIKFKKKFLSKFFNLLVNINISDIKFNNEENKTSFDIIKKPYMNLESIIFKNKILIEKIFIQENNIFILYNNNTFSILQFNSKDNNKIKKFFFYDFLSDVIINFKYYENQDEKIIFFIQKNSNDFFFLNLDNIDNISDEKNVMKKIELKKEYEIFNEENISLKDIFILNEFFLFLTNKEEFILIPNELLKIFKQQKQEKNVNKKEFDSDSDKNSKKSDDEENNDENNNKKKEQEQTELIYPKKLENNYGTIKYIQSNNINVVFINNEYQIYSIPMADCKNFRKKIPKFKLFSEQKFPNFYTMNFSSNSFLLLEKTRLKPLEEWNNEEVYKWLEEMELDDYLNIIKYQKITGKDIIQGGKDYLIDTMGILEDHMNKLNYEMNTLKYETSKDMKLWAWGNNKNGQLGLMNNQTFVKLPTLINLPNLMNDDTIEKVFCYKTCSILLTKFGNIFITGNYSIKEHKKNENGNQNINKKNKGKNKHKEDKNKKGDKNKDKEKNNEKDNSINNNNTTQENKWINISQNICYTSYNSEKNSKKNFNNDSYFKIKEIFGQNNNISFIGFYSNKTPFFAIQRKPKFKHLKKGGKFITSDKVIEHIQTYLKDKIDSFKIVYGDSLLKMLETNLPDYLESEVPFHKIIQIKDNNEVIWDRNKRYFKENFIYENINKI